MKSFEIDGNEFEVVQDSGKVRICIDKEEAFNHFIGWKHCYLCF